MFLQTRFQRTLRAPNVKVFPAFREQIHAGIIARAEVVPRHRRHAYQLFVKLFYVGHELIEIAFHIFTRTSPVSSFCIRPHFCSFNASSCFSSNSISPSQAVSTSAIFTCSSAVGGIFTFSFAKSSKSKISFSIWTPFEAR